MSAPESARRASPARSLPTVVGRFIGTEAAGGIALVIAAAVALAWANSPWNGSYDAFWHSRVTLGFGVFRIDEDLRHFVNDGLMALFFFVVGLEIKRELVHGELSDRRVAALPVFAAIGGMAIPALLFLAIAGGGERGHGWGIPMATDIAFALGVLALLGSRVPSSLKLFLLTLAIVDDVGAIVVIAVFYSGDIDAAALLSAGLGVAVWVALHRLRVDWPPIYVGLAVATWYATYRSGVHATIAGVALALTTPTNRLGSFELARRWAQDLPDKPSAGQVHQTAIITRQSVSPVEHLQELLHPATSFVVLPVFALANAGVRLQSDVFSGPGAVQVAVATAVGLLAGKFIGILAGAWIGTRLGLATRPLGTKWSHVAGAAALGGIGFTVSLFIVGLAFSDPVLTEATKVAILGSSVVAALLGAGILASAGRRR